MLVKLFLQDHIAVLNKAKERVLLKCSQLECPLFIKSSKFKELLTG